MPKLVRQPTAFVFLALVLLGATPVFASASPRPLTRSECKRRVVVDYTAPLRAMPHIPFPSRNGHVAFGPAWLRLEEAGGDIEVGPYRAGFYLFDTHKHGHGDRLGWLAETQLIAIRRDGTPIRRVRTRTARLEIIPTPYEGSDNLEVPFSAKPRYYRIDTVFRDSGGHRLGRYSRYLRVVRSHAQARLRISEGPFKPGDSLLFRLENIGTLGASFGLRFTIERRTQTGWEVDPSSPRGFPDVGFSVGGGIAGSCQSFSIPAAMAPGEYRISKPVELGARPRRNVFAKFEVVAP